MERIVVEVAKAVPALLVMAWIVHRFLNALRERDQTNAAIAEQSTVPLTVIPSTC